MSEIKAVCLDLFGTLVKFQGGSVNSSIYYEIAKNYNLEINDFKKNALTINKSIFDILFEKYNINLKNDEKKYFTKKIEDELKSIVYIQKGFEIISNIKLIGYKSAVCSNIAYPYAQFLHNFLSEKIIDTKVFSCEIGFAKPDVEIYKKVCENLDLYPENILFIGDSKQKDVIGPNSIGMLSRKINFFSEKDCFGEVLRLIKSV